MAPHSLGRNFSALKLTPKILKLLE